MNKRISNPHSRTISAEETIVTALFEMLSAEDAVINLRQPQGFGKKPKLVRERESPAFNGFYGSRGVGTSNSCRGNSNQQSYVKARQVRNDHFTRGRNGLNSANGITREAGWRVPPSDRVVAADAEFYVTVAETKENLEAAVRRRQWFLSNSFESVAQAFSVSNWSV